MANSIAVDTKVKYPSPMNIGKLNFVNNNSLLKWLIKLVLKSPQKVAFKEQLANILKKNKDN